MIVLLLVLVLVLLVLVLFCVGGVVVYAMVLVVIEKLKKVGLSD